MDVRDLGLQDGRRRRVEVAGWLSRKPDHPGTIGPGQTERDDARAALRLLFDSPTTAPSPGPLRPETELPQAVRVQISRPEALD